jgi:hypothetical protein
MKPRHFLLVTWTLFAGVSLSVQGQEFPKADTLRSAPVTYHADFLLPKDSALFGELSDLREQLYRDLKLPKGEGPIQVYLFKEHETYLKFMAKKYPNLPRRRAYFVAQPARVGGSQDLVVFTHWSAHIQKDLRHELTHAYLHSVLKEIPLWLDEGLAVYYESPPSVKHVSDYCLDRFTRLRKTQPKPNLARLEKLDEFQQMTPADYAEAWAWVHLLMNGHRQPKGILVRYLQDLRVRGIKSDALHVRLRPAFLSLNEALGRHLAELDAEKKATRKDR